MVPDEPLRQGGRSAEVGERVSVGVSIPAVAAACRDCPQAVKVQQLVLADNDTSLASEEYRFRQMHLASVSNFPRGTTKYKKGGDAHLMSTHGESGVVASNSHACSALLPSPNPITQIAELLYCG